MGIGAPNPLHRADWRTALLDQRWRARLGLQPEQGGSPDRAADILDGLSVAEWNEILLEDFFIARRAGILTDEGLYGKRCAALDLNELFKSEKVHCDYETFSRS